MADTEFTIDQSVTTITSSGSGFNVETTVGEIDLITIGIQGPPSPVSMVTYTFEQNTPATTWVINHNLGRYPSVTVVDSSKREVIADVIYIDENTIHVIVANAFSGLAYLN